MKNKEAEEVIEVMQKNRDEAIAYLKARLTLINEVSKEGLQDYVTSILNYTIKLLRRNDYEK